MKEKISATIERHLLKYLDSLPGETRSAKIERLIARFKSFDEEKRLRRQLGQYREDDEERVERETWERTMDAELWNE